LSQLYADDPEIPIVVPEINAAALAGIADQRIVTSPDAVAAVAAVVLQPLHQAAEIRRVAITSFEPVSGAGTAGIAELQQQTLNLMSGQDSEIAVFQRRIAFNAIPQIGEILAGGSTRGELIVATTLRRLLEAEIAASVTRVRVPTFYGLALALNVETVQPLSAEDVGNTLGAAPGLLLTEALEAEYSTPADTIGEDSIHVGRLRCDPEIGVADLWVASDNMRKGSAVNAVEIAEILLRDHL
jgi:aspartate-semialdehyde dehydrogenase